MLTLQSNHIIQCNQNKNQIIQYIQYSRKQVVCGYCVIRLLCLCTMAWTASSVSSSSAYLLSSWRWSLYLLSLRYLYLLHSRMSFNQHNYIPWTCCVRICVIYRRLRIQVVYVDFFGKRILFYHLITLHTADVLVYFWHKYSTQSGFICRNVCNLSFKLFLNFEYK